MDTLIFLGVAVASYYMMSAVQAVLHRDFGHRRRVAVVFKAHIHGHHRMYNKNNLRTQKFVDHEHRALEYYSVPVLLLAVTVWLVFGPWIMAAHLLGVFATLYSHVTIHKHYHMTNTPLERFAWFRAKRDLHYVHHQDARYNFAVIEFWVDSLMGTRKNI